MRLTRIYVFCPLGRNRIALNKLPQSRNVGTGGTGGTCPPKILQKTKNCPFPFLENTPFFLRKKVPSKCRAPKFEMLPTSLSYPPPRGKHMPKRAQVIVVR